MSKESATTTDSVEQQKGIPKDALVMGAILKEMGVNEYEPQVINQMLEFTYRYVTTVLEEAKVLADHAQKSSIDADDIKLAISLTNEHSFSSPPPREFLLELAREKNSQPLPAVGEKFGVRLPPERYCLLANNYQLKHQGKGQSSRAQSRSSSISQLSSPAPQNLLVPSAQNLSAIAAMKSPIMAASSTLTLPVTTSSIPSPTLNTAIKSSGAASSPASTQAQTTLVQEVAADEVGVMEDSGDSDEDQLEAMSVDAARRGVKRAHDGDDDDYDNL